MEETDHKNGEERKHGGNLVQQIENGKPQQGENSMTSEAGRNGPQK